MKTLVFLLMLAPSICFANINATNSPTTAPIGSAAHMWLVGAIIADDCEVLCYSAQTDDAITGTMNAILNSSAPPAGDAADMWFAGNIVMADCEVLCITGDIVLSSNVMVMQQCVILTVCNKINDKRVFAQGRKHMQNRSFSGHNIDFKGFPAGSLFE